MVPKAFSAAIFWKTTVSSAATTNTGMSSAFSAGTSGSLVGPSTATALAGLKITEAGAPRLSSAATRTIQKGSTIRKWRPAKVARIAKSRVRPSSQRSAFSRGTRSRQNAVEPSTSTSS
ncbi:hypothetical protein D9M72_477650 [compost metagenome]